MGENDPATAHAIDVRGGAEPETPEAIKGWLALAEVSKFRPTAFARLLGVSLRRLEQEFEAAVYSTPERWLEEVRLWRAARLLTRGMQAKRVARELHYKDESHFYHRFRRYHGCTTTEFLRIFEGLRTRRRRGWGSERPPWEAPDEIDEALRALDTDANRLPAFRIKTVQFRIKTVNWD